MCIYVQLTISGEMKKKWEKETKGKNEIQVESQRWLRQKLGGPSSHWVGHITYDMLDPFNRS